MDAALKRSRSEEPAELLQSARDLEEEEEEGMEQELEEEEEVDPRIQVGRAGGAPDPGLARAAAEIGIHTYTRLAAPSARGPGWGCWRRRSGGKKRGVNTVSLGSSGGCSALMDAA